MPQFRRRMNSEFVDPKTSSLLRDYRPLTGVYDEMLAEGGEPRGHWQKFIGSFENLGLNELAHQIGRASCRERVYSSV